MGVAKQKVSDFDIRSGCVQHESHCKTSCIDCTRLPMSTVSYLPTFQCFAGLSRDIPSS